MKRLASILLAVLFALPFTFGGSAHAQDWRAAGLPASHVKLLNNLPLIMSLRLGTTRLIDFRNRDHNWKGHTERVISYTIVCNRNERTVYDGEYAFAASAICTYKETPRPEGMMYNIYKGYGGYDVDLLYTVIYTKEGAIELYKPINKKELQLIYSIPSEKGTTLFDTDL